jgi:hypothetical protein
MTPVAIVIGAVIIAISIYSGLTSIARIIGREWNINMYHGNNKEDK